MQSRWKLAALVAIAIAPGCALHQTCCPSGSSCSSMLEESLVPIEPRSLVPDVSLLGSPAALEKLAGRGENAAVHYYELSEPQCQCQAAAHSTLGNLLDSERATLARQSGHHVSRSQNAKLDALATAALEARNDSAAAALQLFFALAEGEARLQLAAASEHELQSDLDKVHELRQRGMQVPLDETQFRKQLDDLRSNRIDLELQIAEGNHKLRQLLGMTSADPAARIWPATDLRVDAEPIDPELAVQDGLAWRPEVGLLRRASGGLDTHSLGAARAMLASVHGLLGLKADVCLIAKARPLASHARKAEEVDSRRRQIRQYDSQREQELAEQIRLAVATIDGRLRQVALAEMTTQATQKRLDELKKGQAAGQSNFADLSSARLKSVDARGELIHAIVAWKQAQVKLKQLQGRLVAECMGAGNGCPPMAGGTVIETETPGLPSPPPEPLPGPINSSPAAGTGAGRVRPASAPSRAQAPEPFARRPTLTRLTASESRD